MIKSMYVHVPFCNRICAYCDFTRVKHHPIVVQNWLYKIKQEIQEIETTKLDTLYLGGGTPTALDEQELEQLLCALDCFEVAKEYTIEVNPESLSLAKVQSLAKHKINRISMGVQSFQPHLLKIMNRVHTTEQVQQCLQWFKQVGIMNCSIDLMYGLPNQTMESWKRDLQKAVQLPIQHISLYSLTIEEHSVFGRKHVQPMDDDLEFQMYEYAIDFLNEHGFEQYEVSNFAKKGYESKHNLTYWHYEDFYGVGLGASGKIGNQRYTHSSNFQDYLTEHETMETVLLEKQELHFEAIMMGLRVLQGIDLVDYQRKYDCDLLDEYKEAVDKNIRKGYLECSDGFLRVTRQGMYLLHEVLLEFMD